MNEQEKIFIQNVENILEDEKATLLAKFPFVGYIISNLKIKLVWEGLDTAATDGKKIYVNPLFFAKLSKEEREFVLAHECFHVILKHCQKLLERKPHIKVNTWNVATDLEIHFLLTDIGMVAPFVLPHKKSWHGLPAEDIYSILNQSEDERNMRNLPKDRTSDDVATTLDKINNSQIVNVRDNVKASESPNLKGFASSPSSPSFDQHGFTDSSSSSQKNLSESTNGGQKVEEEDDDDFEEKLDNLIRNAKNFAEKAKGNMPGTVIRNLGIDKDEKSIHKIDWKEYLKDYLTQISHQPAYSWVHPSRKFIYNNIYLPGKKKDEHVLDITVSIDTSGSICSGDLMMFLSEVKKIVKNFDEYKVNVIFCDCEISFVKEYNNDDNPIENLFKLLKDKRISGGGGTSHVPVIEYVNKHLKDTKCLLAFTDGYTDVPKNKPSFPIVWVLTEMSDSCKNYLPYGKKLFLGKRKEDR